MSERKEIGKIKLIHIGMGGYDGSLSEVINALPEEARRYIMWLETDADPAGHEEVVLPGRRGSERAPQPRRDV